MILITLRCPINMSRHTRSRCVWSGIDLDVEKKYTNWKTACASALIFMNRFCLRVWRPIQGENEIFTQHPASRTLRGEFSWADVGVGRIAADRKVITKLPPISFQHFLETGCGCLVIRSANWFFSLLTASGCRIARNRSPVSTSTYTLTFYLFPVIFLESRWRWCIFSRRGGSPKWSRLRVKQLRRKSRFDICVIIKNHNLIQSRRLVCCEEHATFSQASNYHIGFCFS